MEAWGEQPPPARPVAVTLQDGRPGPSVFLNGPGYGRDRGPNSWLRRRPGSALAALLEALPASDSTLAGRHAPGSCLGCSASGAGVKGKAVVIRACGRHCSVSLQGPDLIHHLSCRCTQAAKIAHAWSQASPLKPSESFAGLLSPSTSFSLGRAAPGRGSFANGAPQALDAHRHRTSGRPQGPAAGGPGTHASIEPQGEQAGPTPAGRLPAWGQPGSKDLLGQAEAVSRRVAIPMAGGGLTTSIRASTQATRHRKPKRAELRQETSAATGRNKC